MISKNIDLNKLILTILIVVVIRHTDVDSAVVVSHDCGSVSVAVTVIVAALAAARGVGDCSSMIVRLFE